MGIFVVIILSLVGIALLGYGKKQGRGLGRHRDALRSSPALPPGILRRARG